MGTRIGRNLSITGSLTAEEPIVIVGSFKGEVIAANHGVTIESGARVDGAITARVITIQGGFVGRVIARDVVRVLDGAKVKADIVTPKLGLEAGAVFNGKVDGGTRAEAAARVAQYRQVVPGEPAVRR